MMGCKTRIIKTDPDTDYYEVCAECLQACEEWEEAGADPATLPEKCIGCPFETEED